MDQSEQERADQWWREKWHHGPCPVGQAVAWEPNPKLGQIENLESGVQTLEGGAMVIQGGRVPVFIITCQNCGYMVAINALVAGIRQFPAAEPGSTEGDE